VEFLEYEHLYVIYTCEKNSNSKDLQKESDIPNLPTCVVVRNKGENRFPRIEELLFLCVSFGIEIFSTCDQHHKDHVKKISY
jgi:hypothetical protein